MPPQPDEDIVLSMEMWMVRKMKKATNMVIAAAVEKFGKKINSEQELMLQLSNMIINTYVAESTILRTQKLIQ